MSHRPLVSAALTATLLLTPPAWADAPPATVVPEAGAPATPVKPFGLRLGAELGFLAVASHIIQFSSDGSRFDYVDEGGQDILFPFARFEIDMQIERDHHVTLLYQPLSLENDVRLKRDIRADGIDFPEGTPTTVGYDFPFFRVSYWYDFFEDPRHELSFGGGLQLRNANITLRSADGTRLVSRRDIGPVPLLKLRGRTAFDGGWWIGFEADGFYAPISVLNGSDTEVTGAILDMSLRAGHQIDDKVGLFLNLRWIAGGAVGESDPEPPGDGYQKNWLHFLALSVGAHYQLL